MNRWSAFPIPRPPAALAPPAEAPARPRWPAAAARLACSSGWPSALLAAWLLASPPLAAQSLSPAVRHFPPQAKRAVLEVHNLQEVSLNGQPTRLAPGARIRNPRNALVPSGSLVGQRLVVNYTTDLLGQPHDIWILTEAEAAQRRPGSEDAVLTNIVSDPPR